MNEPVDGPWKVMLLAGTPTVLPGTGVELRWNIDDNAGLLLRRRLPDPPSLIVTVRCLLSSLAAHGTEPAPLLTPGGLWRTRHNEPRSGRPAGAP